MSRDRLIVRNTAFLVCGQLITWTFSLLYLLVVPGRIGPSAWGQLSLAGAITSLAGALLGMSMGTLLIKEIARDMDRARDYLGAALTIRLLLAIPLGLIVVGVAAAGGYDPHTRLVIYIAAAGMGVGFLTSPFGSGLMALEKMHYTTFADVVSNGLLSLVVVALVWFAAIGAAGIALVGLGVAIVVACLQMFWLVRWVRPKLGFNWPLMRSIVIGSLPFAITFLFLSFYTWIDTVMLSFMTTENVVGWYGAATRLFAALLFIPTTLTTALFPALSYSFKHDRSEMNRRVHQSFTLITSLSLPVAAGTVLLAPAAISLIYGPRFAKAGPVLVVLGLTVVPMYLSILVNQILVASDRQVVWTRVMGVMCVLNPAINLATITYCQRTNHNGAVGAAWAMVATEGLMGVLGLIVLPRGLLGWKAAVPVMRSAVATTIMAGVVWVLRDRFLLIPVVAGTVVYFSAAVALRVFPREDMALIWAMAARILRKLGLRYRLRSSAADRADGLPLTMLDLFAEDVRAWQRQGAARALGGDDRLRLRDAFTLLWAEPGVRATLLYRLSAEARRLGIPVLPGVLTRRSLRRYGLDIASSTPIGPGLYLPHPVGTVIRAAAIGRGCHITSAVTIGPRRGNERPSLGDDVYVGAGARVLGGVHIGDGALIGANAVVIGDVPAGATAVGIPARVLAHGPATPADDLREADEVLLASGVPGDAGWHNGNGNGNGHVPLPTGVPRGAPR